MADTISSNEDAYSKWYIDLVTKAELADYSPVKGCMVIRPRGYAMWELMQQALDIRFKETGHRNAYFPLLIPESFISKEKDHVKGFSPELAVVTHGGGEKLEHPLVLRPTSETIIWSMYKKWIQSYRDLPLLINQWANVIRWEKRTRLFLRTTEFLWQEGHTAHQNREEAEQETRTILNVYKDFAETVLAIPVIHGLKTEEEKFAGAVETYAIEALLQDGKSLQAGTSHFLGQNFAKAFDVQFQNENLELEYVWATSWGVSTRLIGAVIMAHSDSNGLIIPPRIAPDEAVIVPIYKSENKATVLRQAQFLKQRLQKTFRIILDSNDTQKPGWKFSEWELRGVPIRVELGPRDLETNTVTLVARDTREKKQIPQDSIEEAMRDMLESIQERLYQKAMQFKEINTHRPENFSEFESQIAQPIPGYVIAPWDGTAGTEIAIKNKTKATIRVISEEKPPVNSQCIYSANKAKHLAVFAKAY